MPELFDNLRSLWRELRVEVDSRFHRTLPFGDYIVDRWEKAKALGFGEGASIYDSALVLGDVTVGANSWIGPGVVLDGSGGLSIGSHCSVGANSQIYSHDTVQWAITGGAAPYEYAATTIASNCFIGANSVIIKGVIVGEGAVIGAGSVVIKDVAAGSRVAGVPARIISK